MVIAPEISRDGTRKRILDAAIDLIAEHGFAATSTRELSERLGFTKAALYYHFRTKDDLLAALVSPALDDLAALAESAPLCATPAARRHLLAGYVDLVAKHEGIVRVLSRDPSATGHPALVQSLAVHERLSLSLAGTNQPDATQRARVRAAFGAIHAALLHALDDDPAVVRDAALAAACGALGIPAGRAHHAQTS